MTLPNGSDGLSASIPFGITSGDGSLPGLVGRNQTNVSDVLKGGIQGSAGWGAASGSLFAGLNPNGSTPFPLLLLQALGGALGIPAHLLVDMETAFENIAVAVLAIPADILNFINWVLSLFGLGGLGGSGGGGGGTVTTPQPTTLGALLSSSQITAAQLAQFAPGATKNVLADPNFTSGSYIQGQGLWCWDGWIGTGDLTGPMGSVRTIRPGLITIYNIVGTSQGVYFFGDEPVNVGGSGIILEYLRDPQLSFLVNFALEGTDQTIFEWINVPYPAAQYPMGQSVYYGAQWLMNQIRETPGPFILIGDSQGCQVAGAVYDELRFGSMQDRRSDLLAGVMFGDLRREKGHTFPGYPDPNPNSSGMCDVSLMTTGPYAGSANPYDPTIGNLVDTEDLWWDMCVAGDYFTCCPIDGNTVDPGAAAVGGNVGDIPGIPGFQFRQFYTFINLAYTGSTNIVTDLIRWTGQYGIGGDIALLEEFLGPVMSQINNLGGVSSPHNAYHTAQPFAAQGDTRTFFDIAIDYINHVGADAVRRGLVHPPSVGTQHQLLGQRFATQPEQVVICGGSIMWHHVVCDGPAFFAAVNAYDADDNLLATITAQQNVISNPASTTNWSWVPLSAAFVMPRGTASACPCINITPAAMTTGIVWADDWIFEPTSTIAGSFVDVTTLDPITGTQVLGPQGEADMWTAWENLIINLTAQNTQTPISGSDLATMLASVGATAQAAQLAYQLGVNSHQILSQEAIQPFWSGMQTSGQTTFPLPRGTTMPTATIAAGFSLMGFINTNPALMVGFVEFQARASGAITGVYLNAYTVNKTTGNMTNVWSSTDLGAGVAVSGSLAWYPVAIATANQFPLNLTDWVVWEIVSTTSTLTVLADTVGGANKPYQIPANVGATRNISATGGTSPTSLTPAQLSYGPSLPFISMSVSALAPDYHPPDEKAYAVGLFDVALPSWIAAGDLVDLSGVAAGGTGGWADGTMFAVNLGQGGQGGGWAAGTFTYGTDIPGTVTALKGIVGHGASSPSGSGGDTIVGYGTLTAPVFDAVGLGAATQGTTMSWTHTATAGAYVLVGLNTRFGTFDVKYDGVPMIPLGLVYNGNNPGAGATALYGLGNAPSGAKTVTVNLGSAAYMTANSISFLHVSCAGLVTNTCGTGTALANKIACDTNQLAVQIFGTAGAPMSAFGGGTHAYYGANPGGIQGLSISYGAPTDVGPPVVFDALGPGATTQGQVTSTTSVSWSHTATAGAYVVVAVGMGFGSGTNVTPTASATYGGVAMTLIGTQPIFNNGAYGLAALFGIPAVAGGAKTVVATGVVASGTLPDVAGNSVSYLNVQSAGLGGVGSGNGATLSVPVSNVDGGVVVQLFAANVPLNATYTGYSQNQRWINTTPAAWNMLTLLGDSVTPGGFAFTATQSPGNDTWGGIAAVLYPKGVFSAADSVVDNWGGVCVALNPAIEHVLLHAAGGQAGGPGGASNYNPENPNTTPTGLSAGPKTWAGRTFYGGAPTAALAYPGNPPGGGASGGNQTTNPFGSQFLGGDGELHVIGRRGASSGGTVGTGGIGGGGTELSVLFEAVGTGGQTVGPSSLSWSHTSGGGPTTAVILFGAVQYSGGTPTVACQYGSTVFPSTLEIFTYYNVSGVAVGLFAFGIIGPPSGNKTVSLTATGATIATLAGNTVSYQNVGRFGDFYTSMGTGTALALPGINAAAGEMIVAGFGGLNNVLTAFNKTQRWAQNFTGSIPMVVGDAAGTGSSQIVSATEVSDTWAGIGGILIPSA